MGRLCTKASWGGVAGGWGSRRAERPGKIVGRRGQGLGEASVLEFAPSPLLAQHPLRALVCSDTQLQPCPDLQPVLWAKVAHPPTRPGF